MNKAVVILLFTLFSGYLVGFVTQTDIGQSNIVSLDKYLKFAVFVGAFIKLLFQRQKFNIPKDIWSYLLPGLIILVFLLINYSFLHSQDDDETFRAGKELVRLVGILITFFLCVTLLSRTADYHFFLNAFAFLGLILAIAAIRHTFTGEYDNQSYYVGDYLRSGQGIFEVNSFAAFLNLTSVVALIGYLIDGGSLKKIIFLSIFTITQIARFATFSNGALLSSLITFTIAGVMIKKYDKRVFLLLLNLSLIMIILLSITLWKTRLYDTVFYRVISSKENGMDSSVSPRLNQIKAFIGLITKTPTCLIWGVGSANQRTLLGVGGTLHNSYLRPLIVGGIVSFICFLLLCWRCFRNFTYTIKLSLTNRTNRIVSILFFAAFVGWSVQAATLPADTSIIQWFFFIFAYLLRHTLDSHNEQQTCACAST